MSHNHDVLDSELEGEVKKRTERREKRSATRRRASLLDLQQRGYQEAYLLDSVGHYRSSSVISSSIVVRELVGLRKKEEGRATSSAPGRGKQATREVEDR